MTPNRNWRRLLVLAPVVVALVGMGCEPQKLNTDMRLFTSEFEFRIAADVVPPRALETTNYTITIRDKKTREPIVNGQGRIFATNADRKTIWDGFSYGPEVGTYHARLMFITAGEWAMNLQFRRDSTQTLVKPDDDWRQMIRQAAEPGTTTP